ncbi:MAG: hypothetical protein JWO03_4110 [Bacteroidetes bacterium]|nr:hypothetical protein [Bacteroidota bacterium]
MKYKINQILESIGKIINISLGITSIHPKNYLLYLNSILGLKANPSFIDKSNIHLP